MLEQYNDIEWLHKLCCNRKSIERISGTRFKFSESERVASKRKSKSTTLQPTLIVAGIHLPKPLRAIAIAACVPQCICNLPPAIEQLPTHEVLDTRRELCNQRCHKSFHDDAKQSVASGSCAIQST